jgi:hypothetical protein
MTDHSHNPGAGQKSFWLIFVIGLVVIALFYVISQNMVSSNPRPDEEAERAALRTKNLEDLQKANEAKLNHYSWVDKAKGVVRIPISRAMELVIPVLSQNHPHPAYSVNATAGAAATPAPSAPQPSASPAPSAAATAQPSPAHH